MMFGVRQRRAERIYNFSDARSGGARRSVREILNYY